jgi:hypothetical protein
MVPARHQIYVGETTIIFDEVMGANVEVFSGVVVGLYHAQVLPMGVEAAGSPKEETSAASSVPIESPAEVTSRFKVLRGFLGG